LPKTIEPTEMPFAADSCGPKETCIRFGQDQTNPFAAADAASCHNIADTCIYQSGTSRLVVADDARYSFKAKLTKVRRSRMGFFMD